MMIVRLPVRRLQAPGIDDVRAVQGAIEDQVLCCGILG